MNEKVTKYYFWITGLITALGNVPMILSPFWGTDKVLHLDLLNIPFAAPLFGHWAMMVSCIGVYLFVAASKKKYRKSAVLYSNFEKGIMALTGWGLMLTSPEITITHYLPMTIADTLFTIGGFIYLFTAQKQKAQVAELSVA
ncbi:hypothetical protein [Flammeovirga kamogawensis]|uniref:Uncharacterized protein n=1 Tax=Flammeovirga kamogawensis TaxID=373891 RepID=A0ABX8GSZ0_9BACT|nr:hypothetical protein [Flammeovirga kamogawensis]MBB6463352.1 hypothetical protein [Flammeovirga kamogawensis]QWG06676.1 hypothetical protein KM029_15370 [Flammeovirga kamogawensis]TRX68498.1 hypothetical protein EO216_10365 [Flammeovirga kamogawensis]